MSKLSPSSSSSRRMSHHPTPHTQQHHGGKHRIYSCACLNLIIHVSSPDTTGQGPADPPLSQHELKCFSTIFDSQQSIFLPSTSSQSTSPSSSLSSSTLTLSSSSTSLPSSLSPAGMSRSYSNSSLPAPHLGGSGSSESFIWGILEKQTIEHADLVTCRTVEGCPAWTLLHCGNCEMDVTAFKHNEYLTQHFRQHANLNINATPDTTASTSTPAFTRTTCVLNGKCVYGEDVLRLRDSDDFSTAFGIIIHRHALSTPISSSPHQSSGLPAALLESSPKNTNATSTTVLGTSPSPSSSSSSHLIPPTLEAHAAQAIANERILMEQRISKFTAAQMSAFQDFQRRTRNELDSLGNVCIEIARDGLTPLPLFSFAIGPRTARSYSKLQAQQRQSLINSINSIAARQTSPQHQHEDEEMISPKDTSPHRAESQSLPPFPPSRLRGQSIQALLTHAQNQSAAAAAASATRQSPTSPSSIDPTSPQSITSTTRTSITAEPTSSAHQASSRARGQSRNSQSSLVRLKIDEEQEDQDTKEVSDDDLLRDDSNKSISRNQTPSSSTIGIDDDRESGNGDDAQIFRFEEEETATAMSSQPYLRHDVVVSGEDNSEDENEADLFDDGTYDEPEGLSPTAAGASTARAPVTPSKPQAQVTAGSGLFSPNTTQAQATLINTMNNTKSNVPDSSKSRFLSSSVPMAIPVQLQSAFTPMKNVAVDADDDEDDDDDNNPLSDDEPPANPHVMGRSARTDRHGQLIPSRRASLNVTIPDTTPPHRIGRSSRTSSTFTRAPQPARDSDDDDDDADTSPSRPEDLDVPAPRVSRRPHDDGDVEDDGVEDEDGEANPIIPPHTLVEEPFFSFAKSKHIAPMPTVSNAMRVTHRSPSTSTSTSTATPPMRIGNSSTSTSTPSSSRTSQPFSLPIRMTGPLGSKQFRRVDE